MKSKEVSKGKTDYEQITFRHYGYIFLIARFKKCFSLPNENGDYLYFIYILKEDYKIAGKEKEKTKIEKFNVMCYNRDFQSFYQMHLLIRPILEDYILESDARLKLLQLALDLNPNHSKE